VKAFPAIGPALLLCALLLSAGLTAPAASYAAGSTITADKVENLAAEKKYIATGHVVITKDDAVYKADKAIYDEKTENMQLSGHVVLEDRDFIISTEKADFNSATKTGVLNNAIIYLKQGKNWIRGSNMKKIGDSQYYGKTVYFTACDSEDYRTGRALREGDRPVSSRPDWCLRGEDANLTVGDKITAKNATFRVKDLPMLYTPYFQGPADNERKTGLLMPEVGNSSKKGFMLRPSFFWVIDDNRDATVSMDYYSKRGAGGSLEYRFKEPRHEGEWFGYYLHDRELKETFALAKINDRYNADDFKAFLNVDYVNSRKYFTEYGDTYRATINRFLQSSAEISTPVSLGSSSRAYLLSQYWVNLREDISENTPQKLPEAGYVLNPTAVGPFMLSMTANAAYFVRQHDPAGTRLDVMPVLSHSMGDTVRFTQSLSLRETLYNLQNGGDYGTNPHRDTFKYRAETQTRFMKNYGSFMHVIEPSVEYSYIPNAKDLPKFDSVETQTKESVITAGVHNRFIFRDITASLRVAQPFDTFNTSDGTLLPTVVRGNINGAGMPVTLNFLSEYNINAQRLETMNSSVSFKVFRDVSLGLGELYSSSDDMMLISAGLNATLSKRWLVSAYGSYDIRTDHKLRDTTLAVTYREQCWSFKTLFTRRPPSTVTGGADYTFMVLLELRGFGAFKI
jgi:LPS-assembly protein